MVDFAQIAESPGIGLQNPFFHPRGEETVTAEEFRGFIRDGITPRTRCKKVSGKVVIDRCSEEVLDLSGIDFQDEVLVGAIDVKLLTFRNSTCRKRVTFDGPTIGEVVLPYIADEGIEYKDVRCGKGNLVYPQTPVNP